MNEPKKHNPSNSSTHAMDKKLPLPRYSHPMPPIQPPAPEPPKKQEKSKS